MGKETNGWAVDTIENEGVAYAVQSYCDGNVFKDPETARLWDAAQQALRELIEYLRHETGRPVG